MTNSKGVGLKIIGQPLFDFSAQKYTTDDFDLSGFDQPYKYTYDLIPKDFITLHVDFGQMGIGGDDSWERTRMMNLSCLQNPILSSFRSNL